MKVGSLFSGAGFGDYGLSNAGYEHKYFCESNEYCKKILSLRFPDIKIYDDIKTMKGEYCDLLIGGFPCQPFSTASRGIKVAEDLSEEMVRIVKESKPKYIISENVKKEPIEKIEKRFISFGYGTTIICSSAYEYGAGHRRNRWFCIAHPNNKSKLQGRINEKMEKLRGVSHITWGIENYARATRVYDGCSNRMDRFKSIGNGIVPHITYSIGKAILEDTDNAIW